MEVSPLPITDSFVLRACPVCGSNDTSDVAFEANWDERRLGQMSYSSRKLPEFMNFRLVKCPVCELLYAPDVPSTEFLGSAYRTTGYDSGVEAQYAATTYAAGLQQILPMLPDRSGALEVGAGNGAFLTHLKAAGFENVVGVEPSLEAVAAAHPEVRPLLQTGTFDARDFHAGSYSLIAAFQTLEHVDDPVKLLADANGLLKPGGFVMVVSHNYRHWLMRMLGKRSPIIDIEHLQIFSPRSLSVALDKAGFTEPQVRPFSNTYPLNYWIKLLPLPAGSKAMLIALLQKDAVRWLGNMEISVSAGNMIAWAKKRLDAGALSSTNIA